MNSSRRIRIGTRESELALFQARVVQTKLNEKGIETEIVEITSDGDIDLVTPLYEMGIQGIFTKSLDAALLQDKIDLAVHSTKDVPTKLAKGLSLAAMLERGTPYDCLVLPQQTTSIELSKPCIIATSSLRRKTQWLHRYPHHTIDNLRGNIQTRLKKLDDSSWSGAIFAHAALQRLNETVHSIQPLDWMLPSPAQGAIGIVCREDDGRVIEVCKSINHENTFTCVSVERDFLARLHGGCAVPISALATLEDAKIIFRGNIFSLDAREKIEVEMKFDSDHIHQAGIRAAEKLLTDGADSIIKTFRPV